MAAKLLYNVIAYEDTAAHWAIDETVYPANTLLIASDTGVVRKGNGADAYADLDDIGALQALKWGDVTEKPTTFAPIIGTTGTTAAAGNHDHVVLEDATSGLAAAANIQALAIALSTRIKALETALETPVEP